VIASQHEAIALTANPEGSGLILLILVERAQRQANQGISLVGPTLIH